MGGRGVVRTRMIVPAALLFGVASACVMMARDDNRPSFLRNLNPLAEKQESDKTVGDNAKDTVSYYATHENWDALIQKVKSEYPNAMEKDTTIGGIEAKVFTVPRVENGRVQLFYPPAQEITIVPRRLELSSGHVVASSTKGTWSGVQLRQFRKPQPIDGIVEWVVKTLKA